MTSKVCILFLFALLFIALAAPSVSARHKWDKQDNKAEKVKSYDVAHKMQVYIEDVESTPSVRGDSRTSLGSSGSEAANASPGFTVDKTYDEWPFGYPTATVGFKGNNDIHFVYHNRESAGDVRRMGYNVYDPTGGAGAGWPNTAEVGCEIQATAEEGRYPVLGVSPAGYVVIAGWDEASDVGENHTFYQTGQHSCFWGSGTQIPRDLYQDSSWLVDPASFFVYPQIQVQQVGDTMWTHCYGYETGMNDALFGGSGGRVGMYCRKPGETQAGDWQNLVVTDTIVSYHSSLTASQVSSKVAISWTKPHVEGIVPLKDQAWFDEEVWYMESTDAGLSWGSKINITNYPRDSASFTAWLESHAMYDSDDNLHILWNASPTLEDAYENPDQNWGTEWSSIIMHWRYLDPSPTDSATSRVYNAVWPNQGGQDHCAFHGYNMKTTGFFVMGECAGRLYVVWSQSNDGGVDPPLEDDCVVNPDGFFGGNGDLFMCMSSDLEGNAWDEYRNITHTITPDCDTAAGETPCQDDTKPYLSKGMDRQTGTLNWNESPDPQTWFWNPYKWADTDSIEGTWTNDSILHLFYVNDHYPGLARADQGAWTENEMRWVQLACVEPVVAPSISADPTETSYPYWTANGVPDTLEIEVRNDGNAELDVVEIGYAVGSGDPDWLGTSVTELLDIPYGTGVYFDIYVNKGGIVDNSPGGSVMLHGDVWLKPAVTDPPANVDSLPITIEVVVCDTMAEMHWDTVATTDPWGGEKGTDEFVALVMDNMGSGGRNGEGGVNLDYVDEGGDCDSSTAASVYLYSGGLLLVQKAIDTVHVNTSMHALGFAEDHLFKPLPDNGFEVGSNSSYDSAYSGTFVNWDSGLVFTRTFYAPRNHNSNPTFVVVKSTMDGADDGSPITGLSIGAADDWDIPADEGSDNVAGVSLAHNLVYIQGTDTTETTTHPDTVDCDTNSHRFGASAFLGYYTATEYGEDSCANTAIMYNSWADSFHGWWDDAVDTNYAAVWDSMTAKPPGSSGNTGEWDQAVFSTWLKDYTLPAGEELTLYSVYVTVMNGNLTDLEASVADAKTWFYDNIRPGCGGCCVNLRGDVDLEGACSPEEQDTDISDLTNMIDHLFINYTPVCCVEEGDVSPWIKGDPPDGAIDIGDLTDMIDHLFINYPPMPSCQYP